jgi:hypothetical protein
MSIDSDGLAFLLLARGEGVRFARAVTLGRQSLSVSRATMESVFAQFGYTLSAEDAALISEGSCGYCDSLLHHFGATAVESLDASSYQGSSIIADMNRPLPRSLCRGFSLVVDGGTLEHIFNAPVALANCMDLVELGGHAVFISPCNNYFGHGFYQFGPEFYFRALTPDNGFVLERVLVCVQEHVSRWLALRDPAEIGERLVLETDAPCTLFVRARRVNDARAFTSTPQEVHYAKTWAVEAGAKGAARRLARKYVPAVGRAAIRHFLGSVRPGATVPPIAEVSLPRLLTRAGEPSDGPDAH